MSSSRVVKKIPKTQAYRKEEPPVKVEQNIDLNEEEEIKSVIEAFETFDADKDGHLSVREFVSMLNNYCTHLSKRDIDEIVKESGLDIKGKMNYREFVEFWKKQ